MVQLQHEQSVSEIRLGKGLKLDGSTAKYEEIYEEGSFSRKTSERMKLKKNVKIETQKKMQSELYEIVVDHAEDGAQWKRGEVVSVKDKHSGDWWEVEPTKHEDNYFN